MVTIDHRPSIQRRERRALKILPEPDVGSIIGSIYPETRDEVTLGDGILRSSADPVEPTTYSKTSQ